MMYRNLRNTLAFFVGFSTALVFGTTINTAGASESSSKGWGEGMQCLGRGDGAYMVCKPGDDFLYCLEVGSSDPDKLGYRCTYDEDLFKKAYKLKQKEDYITNLQKKPPYGGKGRKEFKF